MAGFKTHVSFGVIIGLIGFVLLQTYAIVSNGLLFLVLFSLVVIGSFLPDLDSDTSLPFQVIFGVFSAACALAGFFYLYQEHVQDFKYLVGIPVGILFAVRWIVGPLVKRFTHHRGIFHSIPALFIAMLGSLLMFGHFDLKPAEKVYMSLALGIGFLSHLVLDEMVSFTSLSGIPFLPRQSLGSALKFTSHSEIVTAAAYVLIAILFYFSVDSLRSGT